MLSYNISVCNPPQVIRVLTDNASNMKKAFSISLPDWENDQEMDEIASISHDQQVEIEGPSFNITLQQEANDNDLDEIEEDDDSEFLLIELEFTELLEPSGRRDKSPNVPNKTPAFVPSCPLRTGCTAHTLQLVIKDGLKKLRSGSVY